jgi:hypothetical protein
MGPIMEKLIAERIKQQCTLTQIADRTGWSRGAVWNYENKIKRVPLKYVEDAAQVLGLSLTLKKRADDDERKA